MTFTLTPFMLFSELDSVSGVMRYPHLVASLPEGPWIRDPKIAISLLNEFRTSFRQEKGT